MAFDPTVTLNQALNNAGLADLTHGRPTGPPNTYTRLDHALTIRSAQGRTIGAINGWEPQEDVQIEEEFEVDVNASGLPVDVIVQNLTGRVINISRYDLYAAKMETAFGTRNLIMLSQQTKPFSVREIWRNPDGTVEAYIYSGCWFRSRGKHHRADGNRIVQVNAVLIWTRKDQVI